jgi:hypothetical protein
MGLSQLLDGDQTWLGSNDNDNSQQPTITTINNSNNSSNRHVKQTIVETSEEIIAVFWQGAVRTSKIERTRMCSGVFTLGVGYQPSFMAMVVGCS